MEPFKEEEIKGIICDCEGNKSPDLDGYNINFIKEDYIIAFTDSEYNWIYFIGCLYCQNF